MQQLLSQRADGQSFPLNTQVDVPGQHQHHKKSSHDVRNETERIHMSQISAAVHKNRVS